MHLKSLQITLFITLFFIINCFGQIVSSPNAEGEKWTRIEADEQEISLAFPPGYIFNKETKKQKFAPTYRIIGFKNDVTMELTVNKKVSNDGFTFSRPPNGMSTDTFTKKGLKGRRSYTNPAEANMKETISIEGDKYSYFISVTASDRKKPEVERFIYSIKIKGESLFKNPNAQTYPETSVAVNSLTTSPEVLDAFNRKLEKTKGNVKKEISAMDNQTVSYADYSRAPIVVDQPYPNFNPRFEGMSKGSVASHLTKLKVTLLANGQVGDITIIMGNDNNFNDSCVDAVRKLRFIPAQKNGVNADSVRIIDYNIYLFGTPTMLPGANLPMVKTF